MEEPLIVNRVEITPELFSEAARRPLARKYNRITLCAAGVLALLWAGMAALLLLGDGPLPMLWIETLIFGVVLVWVRVSLPKTECSRAYRQMAQGDAPVRTVLADADRLAVRSGEGKETVFAWPEVTAWRETEHLLILTCGGSEVLLSKEGFETGDKARLLSLLSREKT